MLKTGERLIKLWDIHMIKNKGNIKTVCKKTLSETVLIVYSKMKRSE